MDLDVNVLEGKLNAILDRPAEEPISRPASPSIASTSSEALQYHSAVYRKPETEEERAQRDQESEYLRSLTWGDEPTRRAREEEFKQERAALGNLALRGWGMCEEYEQEIIRLAALRTAEDALEYQRQEEDYLQVTDKLSIFLTGDEESESERVLRYRLRHLKTLLQLYDSQWHRSFIRLREDADKRKQLTQDPAEQSTLNNTLTDGIEQLLRLLGTSEWGIADDQTSLPMQQNLNLGLSVELPAEAGGHNRMSLA
ncbi:hypothetical protein DV735_g3547, partial [Chaetothyriales sp. CBS 134920]